MPQLVPVAGDEYELICECGFHEYYSPTCTCTHCKATTHPISQCPECGAQITPLVLDEPSVDSVRDSQQAASTQGT